MIAEAIQLQILNGLFSEGVKTAYGRKHQFEKYQSYQEYKDNTPLILYNDINDVIEKVKEGQPNLLWPGNVEKFAVSSGTIGKGKHLPLTENRLFNDRYFMKTVFWNYLKQRPNLLNLAGKQISLPGTIEKKGQITIGEISGFSAEQAPSYLRPFQLINPKKLNRLPFRDKFNLVLERSVKADIRVIVAVPSWILTLFQKVLQRTGKQHICEVWPNLQVMVCGGVKLANYKSHLLQLIGDKPVDFIETYGASEGFFAFTDDLDMNDMKLVYDNGIFYEFIPDPLPGRESLGIQPTIPLWEVETGTSYAMVVSTTAGLWRYGMDDVIEFTSLRPLRINVKGRVDEVLDEYGEALYLYEAEEALREVLKEMNLNAGQFTIGAYLKSETDIPLHYWFIQFETPIHTQTLEKLGKSIDKRLMDINRHYAIRRDSEALGMPEIHSINQYDINRWLEQSGSYKAQGKLPKLLTERDDVEFFL